MSVKSGKSKIAIGCIYRPPSIPASCLNDMELILSYLNSEYDELILTGDLNLNFLQPSPHVNHFCNILNTFDMHQIIKAPTRITLTSSTLLDVICLNNSCKVIVSGTEDLDFTDHSLIYCTIDIKVASVLPGKVWYRDYSKFVMKEFERDASNINWEHILTLPDIDSKLTFFISAIHAVFDIHAPIKSKNIRKKSKPYITPTIQRMIKLKNRAHSKYKRTRLQSDKKYFIDLKNYVNFAIKQEKIAFMKHQIKTYKSNPKQLWKKFSSWHIHSKAVNEIDDRICNVETINKYFVQSALQTTTPDANLVQSYLTTAMFERTFAFSTVTSEDIERSLATICSNAIGADQISTKMLRLTLPYCKSTLCHIINFSLTHGVVPNIWKQSLVLPLAKVPKATELKQLRPISILPTLSKVIERLVHNSLVQYIEEHNILPPLQSGFRKHYSTCTALLKVTSDIARSMDQSQVILLALLDFSKAFDSLDHNLIIAKLHYYGCNDIVLKWFSNYLNGRTQCVKIGEEISSARSIVQGVPQGSILGPLLFTIYTADLTSLLSECEYHMYADDTQLYISSAPEQINNIATKLNYNIGVINKWCKSNSIILNPVKSQVLCIGSPYLRAKALQYLTVSISLDSQQLELVDCAKNLGIYLDSHMKFEKHVLTKSALCYGKLRYLRQFKFLLPDHIKWTLANSLVLCHVNYASSVYYNFLTLAFKKKIQSIQNACFRFAFNTPFRSHVTPLYVEKRILKIEYRFKLNYCKLIFYMLLCQKPRYLFNSIELRKDAHSVDLRLTTSYSIPQHKTTTFKACFAYFASKLLNDYSCFFILSCYVFRLNLLEKLLDEQKSPNTQ